MAKSDSFFIRAGTNFNGTTYAQSSIDLGAYVDALGKSVLRIHNVVVQWGDANEDVAPDAAIINSVSYQLTTQSKSALVNITDKSLIASGRLIVTGDAGGLVQDMTELSDVAPQEWMQGYLIGVEQIYLGVDSTSAAALGFTSCNIVMECTVETLSQSAAMALSLSQQ